ncbi:MAG TPA: prepilin peptidase [Kofleriaceae bacterium]|nr:prepilin peptidase [Kofleriaceae bacterium]
MLRELEPLAASPSAYAFVAVLGLLWGSFANVCIYRWPPTDEFPDGRSVVRPGSHCFSCGAPIRWYDNVPLLSWLWLRGRCRACKAPFSPRYLLVEALTGVLFALAWWATTAHVPAELRGLVHAEPFDVRLIRFAIYAAFILVMVVIAFIDLDHKLILNKVTVPSIAVFYGLGLLLPERAWWEGLVGIAVGYGVPWAIGEAYYRATGREGLGLGDGMLLALVGSLLGWKGVAAALFGGSMIGSVLGLAALALARRRGARPDGEVAPGTTPPSDEPRARSDEASTAEAPSLMRTELPFGPFLAMAAVFYLSAEPWIWLYFRFPGG